MDEELICSSCKDYFINPVLLPCGHSLCLSCALAVQGPSHDTFKSSYQSYHDSSDNTSEHDAESDKISLVSETDSGVVCNSRPNSLIQFSRNSFATSSLSVNSCNALSQLSSVIDNGSMCLECLQCHNVCHLDESGANGLPRNKVLANLVLRHSCSSSKTVSSTILCPPTMALSADSSPVLCQLCEGQPLAAVVLCEQCEVFYCQQCQINCHPPRGPLAQHSLIPALRISRKTVGHLKEAKCSQHVTETLSMYCAVCKLPVCCLCLQDDKHINHDVRSLPVVCKSQKSELSHNLQSLSERAKSAAEILTALKQMNETIEENSIEFENHVSTECDRMTGLIQERKHYLLQLCRLESEIKRRHLREQITKSSAKLHQTTSLIQFCIESLKEQDSSSFLQTAPVLISRVNSLEIDWRNDLAVCQKIKPEVDLSLDMSPIVRAVEDLNFVHLQIPNAPQFIYENCTVENNSLTIYWEKPSNTAVDGFVLELDGGRDEEIFREVYCGSDTNATTADLHFHSTYQARIKCFNRIGESEYSPIVIFQTSEESSDSENLNVKVSGDVCTMSGTTSEYYTLLGSVCFSRGVHYWEVVVDKCENNADVVIGVALADVDRDVMLGKDSNGWSMYVDGERSWFLHDQLHSDRTSGGVQTDSVVGILLDCDKMTLSFFINHQQRMAFRNLPRASYFPAFSVNFNVQLTLHSGLVAPMDSLNTSDSETESKSPE